MLDAFDLIVLTLSLTAIGATFNVGTGATGALSTVTLSASAVGGILGGLLADRIGRARTLMLSVGVYSLFTFLSGLASSYEMLMVFRVFQGIGFGAEWGVGAVLVAELVRPRVARARAGRRSRARGPRLGAGRRRLPDRVRALRRADRLARADVPRHPAGAADPLRALARRGPGGLSASRARAIAPARCRCRQILQGKLLRTTVAASLLATGIQGGYYAMFTWIPTYLKKERDLTIVGTSGYLFVVIAGAFLGYLSAGWVHDRLGRRRDVRAVRGAGGRVAGRVLPVPAGSNTTLLLVGFPLGFFASGCFSGFGSYLAELYPTRARATGEGFCYNVGRGIGALFPGIIGFLAASIGLGGAIAFGVFGYVLAIAALALLPETHGREIRAIE